MKFSLPVLLALGVSSTALTVSQASAEPITDRLYLGAGISHNVIDSPFGGRSYDAFGTTFFGGLTFDNNYQGLMTAMEFSYSDTEDFFDNNRGDADINGFAASLVAEKSLPEIDARLAALGRIGVDFGDDDGILLGAGASFKASEALGFRAEYINKDASNVYQLSALIHF
ncbi:MAG: hypothetical protein P1U57_05950 [Oleibacter sp.]|nr:hypothetical protein [Thalassolituus sp.]